MQKGCRYEVKQGFCYEDGGRGSGVELMVVVEGGGVFVYVVEGIG